MSTKTKATITIAVVLALVLILGGGGTIGGGSAPYPLPDGMPVAVSYAIDGSIEGVQALGKTAPGLLSKVMLTAGANNYREVDVNTSKTEPADLPWAVSAWKALDKTKPPQWVASGPRGGWASKAMPSGPKAADEAEAALKGIMKQ